MKDNLIHICFVLDESGSMHDNKERVLDGFNSLISEQKELQAGECLISLFKFSEGVIESFIGRTLNELPDLEYYPYGYTSMNDGIGTAIDRIGQWLNSMEESQRPFKNIVVIMTDGHENNSKEYSLDKIKSMIKHQEEKYNWAFVYMGTNLTSLDDATELGIYTKSISSGDNIVTNYNHISKYASSLRQTTSSSELLSAYIVLKNSMVKDTELYKNNRAL